MAKYKLLRVPQFRSRLHGGRSVRLRATTARSFVVLVCVAAVFAAVPVREIPSPAGPGSGQPNLTVGADGSVYLSWIERLSGETFSLRFSRREARGWSRPRTIAEGSNWFVNWADFPSMTALPDGRLAAHWLVKNGEGTYAYDVNIALSEDGGESWSAPVTPHRDGTQTEHGFVSLFPTLHGELGAVWLDGREMKGSEGGHGQGDMTLRYAEIQHNREVASEQVLDDRVCECCQTSAALTEDGPIVVYRDRSRDEIRDISFVRLKSGRWTQPRPLHHDGWQIHGCPVNGPAVAASGKLVAVAWFTGAEEKHRVRAAFSPDAGDSFGAPVDLDDGSPLGRVDLALSPDGDALVTWLAKASGGAEIRARWVSQDGRLGKVFSVTSTSAARSSGFPQTVRIGDRLIFAWTASRVLTAEMEVAVDTTAAR